MFSMDLLLSSKTNRDYLGDYDTNDNFSPPLREVLARPLVVVDCSFHHGGTWF